MRVARHAGSRLDETDTSASSKHHPRDHQRVQRRDAVEQFAHQPGHRHRHRQPDRQADGGEAQSLPHHQAENVGAARAQRHTDPDLSRPLCHVVGQHAVHADRRQHSASAPKVPTGSRPSSARNKRSQWSVREAAPRTPAAPDRRYGLRPRRRARSPWDCPMYAPGSSPPTRRSAAPADTPPGTGAHPGSGIWSRRRPRPRTCFRRRAARAALRDRCSGSTAGQRSG